ncbi:hypothetical protein OTU49_014681 [Cherax quadricarinatus]|uniref:Uncharacterized protein n=1 Tax=Cherax quadricarinatus TaxID=27406 RepID=A0AAW0VNF9_CHEQU
MGTTILLSLENVVLAKELYSFGTYPFPHISFHMHSYRLLVIQNFLFSPSGHRAAKRNFARQNKTALGPLGGLAEVSLRIENLKSSKTIGKLSQMLYFLCSRMTR